MSVGDGKVIYDGNQVVCLCVCALLATGLGEGFVGERGSDMTLRFTQMSRCITGEAAEQKHSPF